VRVQAIDAAIREVQEKFPFKGYVRPKSGSYGDIARTLLKWITPPAKLLDFGAGPCDKTAVLSLLGFDCSACDDLRDNWHLIGDNQKRILEFARELGIRFSLIEGNMKLPFRQAEFDALLMHDVLEHLHESPKGWLLMLLDLVKPEGFLFVTVPNAVNLVKRAKVLCGKTNLPSFDSYYWYPGPWRGHVREYTKDDLRRLCEYLDLDVLELRGSHHALNAVPSHLKPFWIMFTSLIPSARDELSLVAKKAPNWSPRNMSNEELVKVLGRSTSYEY